MTKSWGGSGGGNWVRDLNPDKEHVIAGISYAKGYVLCRCGTRMEQGDAPSLDDVWAMHLGKEYRPTVYQKAQLATDGEVKEFLGRLSNPWYTAPLLKAQSYTPRVSDRERARDAMYTIVEMGLRCTCTGRRPSRDCPNFIEGDDQ